MVGGIVCEEGGQAAARPPTCVITRFALLAMCAMSDPAHNTCVGCEASSDALMCAHKHLHEPMEICVHLKRVMKQLPVHQNSTLILLP